MIELNSSEFQDLKDFLEKFELRSALSQLAGLLTVPSLQANSIRIETAVHLAVAHCRGRRRAKWPDIERCLKAQLEGTQVQFIEEPAEDVFITNLTTLDGNRRIFQSSWDASDCFAQVVIDLLSSDRPPEEWRGLLKPVLALLKLSDHLAERNSLQRWHHEPATPSNQFQLPAGAELRRAAGTVHFSQRKLKKLGIDPDDLSPFVFMDANKGDLSAGSIRNTSLERRPLVRIGNELIVALPSAVSAAIRRYVVGELLKSGGLDTFASTLAAHQAGAVEAKLYKEFDQAPLSDAPIAQGELAACQSLVVECDVGTYLHALIIPERLDCIDEQGFVGADQLSQVQTESLRQHIAEVADWCRSQPGFMEGMTLLVNSGLGRGLGFGTEIVARGWHLSGMEISDFFMLADEYDQPITRYLKFFRQKTRMENSGLRFFGGSDYVLYCLWRDSDRSPVPPDIPLDSGSHVAVLNDCALPVRKEVRVMRDSHMLPTLRGRPALVTRLNGDSIFPSQRVKPIYRCPPSLEAGVVVGAVETTESVSWLMAFVRPGDRDRWGVVCGLWDGLIDLYEKLIFQMRKRGWNRRKGALEVQLDCSRLLPFDQLTETSPLTDPADPEVQVDLQTGKAVVRLQPDFLRNFRQAENVGERLLVRALARCLIQLHQRAADVDRGMLDSLTESIAGDPGLRLMHTGESSDPIVHMRQRKSRAFRAVPELDRRFAEVGLSNSLNLSKVRDSLDSRTGCNEFVKQIVEELWNRIKSVLQGLDRTSVLGELLARHEAIAFDRDHWAFTSRAVLALNEDGLQVAQLRESERASAGLAVRSLLEMAICECPTDGGRAISTWQADELLATVLNMLNTASCSDAVHNGLVTPGIELFANGDYTMDHRFMQSVRNPLLTAYNQVQIEDAAKEYPRWYSKDETDTQEEPGSTYPDELVEAFQAEYGLTPRLAARGLQDLLDLAVETDELVIEATVGEVKSRLLSQCGYSDEACDAFLQTFGLFHRPKWETPPSDCSMRDIWPWRYSRRLSLVVRPILVFGEGDDEKILYSVNMLRIGYAYLLRKIQDGSLPQNFFTSQQMRRYIGGVNDRLGTVFEEEIAGKLRNRRWNVRRRVPMTELGAPAALGDIDVLAWKEDREVFLIECKRLQLARTVAEMAEVCRRFQGAEKDELDKHLRRVEWIQQNAACLTSIVGFLPTLDQIDHGILTSTLVPMTYLSSFPLDPEKIGLLTEFPALA